MLNGNAHKNFSACGDPEAEALLKRVLTGMKETLSGTELCVVLGGSYGRGDGGVRQDRENGILYNDLDFFVFARKKNNHAEILLKEIAEKYEKELKVDVDFSRIMTVGDIRNNAKRLMMQELKRGYRLVFGEDLLAEFLPELPADKLPFSEACRLLLNRGMGLLLAGEKIMNNSPETDFILRNIYKAILGAGDAMMIAEGKYRWNLAERLDFVEKSAMPDLWKNFYREAVQFKQAPHRRKKQDMISFWNGVRDFFQAAITRCSGDQEYHGFRNGIYNRCCACGETSFKNYIKYCIKSRTLQIAPDWQFYTIPSVAVLIHDVYLALNRIPDKLDKQSKLYQQWLIFN